MEWDTDIDLSRRKITSRLIVQRALARGWRVCGFRTNQAILLLYLPGRKSPLQIFSASPPQMSYPAVKIAQDKYITNQLLAAEGLPVPAELLVDAENIDKEAVAQFMDKHRTLVVKPLDSAHGKGVTVNIRSLAGLEQAIADACTHPTKGLIVVQEQVEGIDVRIVCIDYAFADAISRSPALVTGDGEHTVQWLIEHANAGGDRGQNYRGCLNVIPMDEAAKFLTDAGLARVPAAQEKVQVIGVANVGMGGERHNIRDRIPKSLQAQAIQAARTLELPVCGVDFIVRTLPEDSNAADDLEAKIIEVNNCPSLPMYEDLDSVSQIALVDRYLDYVAKVA